MIVGLGIDVVDIPRVERMLASKGDHMLARLFTPAEVEYAHGRREPARHLAARLAAKEAAYKALAGTESNALARAVGWRELEVFARHGQAPQLLLHGRAERRAAELGVARVLVSLTHSHETAAAVVILERE